MYENKNLITQSEQDSAPGHVSSLSVIQCDLVLLGCIHISNIFALINTVPYHSVDIAKPAKFNLCVTFALGVNENTVGN